MSSATPAAAHPERVDRVGKPPAAIDEDDQRDSASPPGSPREEEAAPWSFSPSALSQSISLPVPIVYHRNRVDVRQAAGSLPSRGRTQRSSACPASWEAKTTSRRRPRSGRRGLVRRSSALPGARGPCPSREKPRRAPRLSVSSLRVTSRTESARPVRHEYLQLAAFDLRPDRRWNRPSRRSSRERPPPGRRAPSPRAVEDGYGRLVPLGSKGRVGRPGRLARRPSPRGNEETISGAWSNRQSTCRRATSRPRVRTPAVSARPAFSPSRPIGQRPSDRRAAAAIAPRRNRRSP